MQISLIKEHTERIKPPRALWVPFDLGRPLGVPNDAGFQTKVLLSALKMFEAQTGPVLDEFTEQAPISEEETLMACMLPLSSGQSGSGSHSLKEALMNEIENLATWYELSVKRRGRTTVGLSGLNPEEIANLLTGFIEGDIPDNSREDISLPWLVKLGADDIKAYYFEAITAQPGNEKLSSLKLNDWLWQKTKLGELFLALKPIFSEKSDPEFQEVGDMLLVPLAQETQ